MHPWQIMTLAKVEQLYPAVSTAQHRTMERVLNALCLLCFPAPAAVFRQNDELHVSWHVRGRVWEVAITPNGSMSSSGRSPAGSWRRPGEFTVDTENVRRDAVWLLHDVPPEESVPAGAVNDGFDPPVAPSATPASFTTPFLAPQRIVDWLNRWRTHGAAFAIRTLVEAQEHVPTAILPTAADPFPLCTTEYDDPQELEPSAILTVLGLLNSLLRPYSVEIVANYLPDEPATSWAEQLASFSLRFVPPPTLPRSASPAAPRS